MLNNFIQNILDKVQGNSFGEGYVIHSEDIYERPIPFSKTIRINNMKKAILVNDYASVEELNKLFEQGYTVESVDDRGVYILKRDESKQSANNLHENQDKHLNIFDRKDKDSVNQDDYQNLYTKLKDEYGEPKIMNPYTKSETKRGLGGITINVKVEVDDSELKQLGEKYSHIGKIITEAFDNGK